MFVADWLADFVKSSSRITGEDRDTLLAMLVDARNLLGAPGGKKLNATQELLVKNKILTRRSLNSMLKKAREAYRTSGVDKNA